MDNRPLTVKIDPHPSKYTLSGFKKGLSWSSGVEKGMKNDSQADVDCPDTWELSGYVGKDSLATPVREPVDILLRKLHTVKKQ